jgi:serine/threonine protein kinase
MSVDKPNQPDPSPEGDPWIGRVLGGRYRLEVLLGSGSMGRVYRAEHVLMHKPLAVKILNAEHAKSPELVARFEREAIAAANIEHANVVAATDCAKLEDGTVYLALELIEGKNLRAEIARGALECRRALHIARQIAAGLAAAHAKNIVHRDLKPENVVLVEKEGDHDFVKILDFGIAKLAPESGKSPLTRVGVVLGTLDYMAPEQALGQSVDHRADLYALGTVTYEMLCGVCPFEGESSSAILALQLKKAPPPFGERVPGLVVPAGVEALVMKLLAKDRNDRPQSASSVAAELERLLASMPRGTAPAVPPPPAARSAVPALNKPTFLPTDPLPAFTFPPLEEESKKLAAEVKQALAAQASPTASSAAVDALLAHSPTSRPPAPPASRPPPPPASKGPAPAAPLASRPAASPQPTAPAKPAPLAELRAASGRAVEAAIVWIDDHRRFLPRFIKRPLRRVPSGALLVASVCLFVLLLAIAFSLA